MSARKTILSMFHDGFFVRNILRTDALPILLNAGVRLVLLVPKDKIDYYKKEFPDERGVFDVAPNIRGKLIERFFNTLERFSIHTNTIYMIIRSEFARSGNVFFPKRLAVFCFKICLWAIGYFKLWRMAVRGLYRAFPSGEFGVFFKKYNPDLVFLPYMMFSDYALLKEAKKEGIKTLGMTLSWDNLYSKTFLLTHPDYLIVQTDIIANQVREMGDYNGGLSVAGIPQYDFHFKKTGIVSRDEFMRSIGADPQKKTILYAFSGKQGMHLDFEILSMLVRASKKGKFIEPIEIIARPYPRSDFPKEKFEHLKREFDILGESSTAHIGTGSADWEFDEHSIAFLENSLAHADIVITMYSTFFIEAAIYGKPLVGVAFDGEKERSYWDSAKRFFEWDHLRDIKPLGGIWLTKSKEELVEAVNVYLKNPDFMKEGREKIVQRQVQFVDGLSGQRVAEVILNIL